MCESGRLGDELRQDSEEKGYAGERTNRWQERWKAKIKYIMCVKRENKETREGVLYRLPPVFSNTQMLTIYMNVVHPHME